ncbi:MAG TPA: hypothetical protein PLB00_01000 [Pseudomonadota bacterium]|nr:hypothetical protein [Pseudomonadota bacterium]
MRSLSSFVAFAWLGIGLVGVEASAQQLDPSFGHGGRLSLSMDDVGDGLIQEIPAAVVPTSPEILAVVSTRGSANGNGDARVGVMLRRRNGQVLSCVQTDPDCDRQSNSVSAPVQVPVRAVDAVYVPNWLGPEAADGVEAFSGTLAVLANTQTRAFLLLYGFSNGRLQAPNILSLGDFGQTGGQFEGRRVRLFANGHLVVLAQQYANNGFGTTRAAIYVHDSLFFSQIRAGLVAGPSPSEVRDLADWNGDIVVAGDLVRDDDFGRRHAFAMGILNQNGLPFAPSWGHDYLPPIQEGQPIQYPRFGPGNGGDDLVNAIRWRSDGYFELDLDLDQGFGPSNRGFCASLLLSPWGGVTGAGATGTLRDDQGLPIYTQCARSTTFDGDLRFSAAVNGSGLFLGDVGLVGWSAPSFGTSTFQSLHARVNIGSTALADARTASAHGRMLLSFGQTPDSSDIDLEMLAFLPPPLFADGFE